MRTLYIQDRGGLKQAIRTHCDDLRLPMNVSMFQSGELGVQLTAPF